MIVSIFVTIHHTWANLHKILINVILIFHETVNGDFVDEKRTENLKYAFKIINLLVDLETFFFNRTHILYLTISHYYQEGKFV